YGRRAVLRASDAVDGRLVSFGLRQQAEAVGLGGGSIECSNERGEKRHVDADALARRPRLGDAVEPAMHSHIDELVALVVSEVDDKLLDLVFRHLGDQDSVAAIGPSFCEHHGGRIHRLPPGSASESWSRRFKSAVLPTSSSIRSSARTGTRNNRPIFMVGMSPLAAAS